MNNVVTLLQQANRRIEHLQQQLKEKEDKLSEWRIKYWSLNSTLCELQSQMLCDFCKETRPDGETVELCSVCSDRLTTREELKASKRYWQGAYESLLEWYHDRGSDDGSLRGICTSRTTLQGKTD